MSNAQSGIYTSVGIMDAYINSWVCRYFRCVPESARSQFRYRFRHLQGNGKQTLGLHQGRCVASIGIVSPKVFKCAISKLHTLPKIGEKSKMNSTDIKVENILHLWYAYLKFYPKAYVFSVKNKS